MWPIKKIKILKKAKSTSEFGELNRGGGFFGFFFFTRMQIKPKNL